MGRLLTRVMLLPLVILLLAGCPVNDDVDGGADTQSETIVAIETTTASDDTPPPPTKQLVLIYSGDTLAKLDANLREQPVRGGLPALAAMITNYEAQITQYNRQRIINEGSDASHICTDLDSGFLGEHPFMLLDYGGWTRPNDFAGAPYVGLYMEMFAVLRYAAVGCKQYLLLPDERWDAYREYAPVGFTMLVSAGDPPGDALPVVPIVTRTVHDGLWGVVSVPLVKPTSATPMTDLEAYIDAAADELADAGCDYSILMMSEVPASKYRELAGRGEFTVIIGAPKHVAVPEGYGKVADVGTILLPELEPGGRSIGVCHIYYSEVGTQPEMFYFSTKLCLEHYDMPFPFRQQVVEAKAEHEMIVAEHVGNAE